MSHETPHLYAFGPFRFDPDDRLLLREREVVPLTPKATELLSILVTSAGRVLSKDDLMRRLWPETFVEEANLSHHVYKLREALGSQPDGRDYIETLARRGYRFVADVEQVPRYVEPVPAGSAPAEEPATPSEPPPRARWSRTAALSAAAIVALAVAASGVGFGWITRGWTTEIAPSGPIRSLAVLPFAPLEGTADEALSVGMAAAVITRLTRVPEIVVRPASAMVRYTGGARDAAVAGREQSVDAVLDAQVQTAGERIRVTVQLVRTRDGRPIWGESYDEPLRDVFAIQDAIATRVVSALRITLGDGSRRLALRETDNVAAYQAYLNGAYHAGTFAPGAFEKSAKYLNEAVRLDPKFASAHATLAFTYAQLAGLANEAEAVRLAKTHAQIAADLDDTVPDLYAALVIIRQYHDWDWAGAEAAWKRMLEVAPGDARSHQMAGWAMSLLGRFDEGLAELRRAQAIDPLSSSGAIVSNLTWSRRLDEALQETQKLIAAEPGSGYAQEMLAQIYLMQGRHAEAVRVLERAVTPPIIQLGSLAYAYGMAGRRADAERQIATLNNLAASDGSRDYRIAIGYAGLGDKTRAIDWLERAYRHRSYFMAWLKVEPAFDSLRSEPRFKALMARIRLLD